ncbi:MAG: serine hydrolase [Candidatus Aminicenantes bacterium RBG_13_62_12]|jgi:CubicO group peptidase (beta-lactamase class C family)|nr:MAG: serine hydrolase [Candidatus Aminicenantes bacterium RBG_13_62_12]
MLKKFWRNALIATLTIACMAPAVRAQTGDVDSRVDTFVQDSIREQRIPGLALAVMRDGQVIKAKGYGLSNIELNTPVSPQTISQSGSMGKQFTATGIMMLVEEGKVGLDDKVAKYFPGAPESWNKFTVRNLLTHTSGIKEYTGKDFDYRRDYTEEDLLKMAQAQPFDFAPGDKWSYSNTGYMLLGMLIHKVTGKFYGDFLQERIFKPLGMTTTRIISEEDIVPNRAAGYRLVKGVVKNQEWVNPTLNTTADGSLYFTVLDLAKWDAVLYTEKLIKRTSLDQMWTPVKLNDGKTYPYGFGWRVAEMNGHRLIEHGGSWQGFTTGISRYVDDKLTVVALTNLDSRHSRPDDIIHGVAGIYIPALTPPAPAKGIEDKEPQVTSLFRDLLQKIGQGKADAGAFTEEARKKWFPGHVKEFQEDLEDFGPAKTVDLLERKEEAGLRSYVYRLTFEDGRTLKLNLKLTDINKIAALDTIE